MAVIEKTPGMSVSSNETNIQYGLGSILYLQFSGAQPRGKLQIENLDRGTSKIIPLKTFVSNAVAWTQGTDDASYVDGDTLRYTFDGHATNLVVSSTSGGPDSGAVTFDGSGSGEYTAATTLN